MRGNLPRSLTRQSELRRAEVATFSEKAVFSLSSEHYSRTVIRIAFRVEGFPDAHAKLVDNALIPLSPLFRSLLFLK